MSVRLVFLGPLADREGAAARAVPAPLDWERLLASVAAGVAQELRSGRVHLACNGKILEEPAALLACDGDEVALLPPVSGG
jgi:sulfur-carrier protein